MAQLGGHRGSGWDPLAFSCWPDKPFEATAREILTAEVASRGGR